MKNSSTAADSTIRNVPSPCAPSMCAAYAPKVNA